MKIIGDKAVFCRIISIVALGIFLSSVVPKLAIAQSADKLAGIQAAQESFRNGQNTPSKVVDPGLNAPSGMRVVQGLFICAAVFFIGIHLYRKYVLREQGAITKRQIKIIERTAITPKTALVLVEFEGKKLILAVGSEQVSNIALNQSHNEATEEEIKEFENTLCENQLKLSA